MTREFGDFPEEGKIIEEFSGPTFEALGVYSHKKKTLLFVGSSQSRKGIPGSASGSSREQKGNAL